MFLPIRTNMLSATAPGRNLTFLTWGFFGSFCAAFVTSAFLSRGAFRGRRFSGDLPMLLKRSYIQG